MSEGDEIVSLLFYVILVHPTCNWILSSKRFSKQRAIWYAIGFLSFIAFGKVGLEWNYRGPNHYQLLGVNRTSSPLEIKKAYKKLGLELHPDKNPSPEAAEQFASMKDAYDVLMDIELRDIYNKLGPDAIKNNQRLDETQLLLQIGLQYVVWGIFAYFLTMGKSGTLARSYIFSGEVVMIVTEVCIISSAQGTSVLPTWFVPSMSDYDIVWIMRSLFPAYMNACRSICGYLYVDLEKQTRDLLIAVQKGQNDMMLKLQLLHNETRDWASSALTNGNQGRIGAASQPKQSSISNRVPSSQLRELEERMKETRNHINILEAPKAQPSKGKSSIFFIIAGYALFYYFFQQSQ